MHGKDHRKALDRDGYVVVPGVLTTRDIERLRNSVTQHFRTRGQPYDGGFTQPDAFRHVPEIRWLLAHPRVGAVFRELVGNELVYCHHSDVHANKYTGWHKDACGRDDFSTDSDGECYGVYKMAFYLQDHTRGPAPLTVRAGSHRSREIHAGSAVELHPALGDAIVFDCRISHKGTEMHVAEKLLSRALPDQALRTRVLGWLWRRRQPAQKLSLFFTLGRPNRFLTEHVATTVQRQLRQLGESSYELPGDLARVIADAGFGLADLGGSEPRRAAAQGA